MSVQIPPAFTHHELRLLNPEFASPLVAVLLELEHVRKLQLGGTTPFAIFIQLKSIFHMLESIGSARIEGNHTTIADYVETKIEQPRGGDEQFDEISNIERSMDHVDETVQPGLDISEAFIRQLHAVTVQGLNREGDRTPGRYRGRQVRIAGSLHLPPPATDVPILMRELVDFINRPDDGRYDLMKVALAHHRFGWIHPFENGNGRVVRLLTYAMLLKYGFNVGAIGRVLNPTAVFCNDRHRYYAELSAADEGSDGNLERWCLYVLSGILAELKKLDRLADFEYVKSKVLIPAINLSRDRELITKLEHDLLRRTLEADGAIVKSADLEPIMRDHSLAQRTYRIRTLVEARMLSPIREGARQYTLSFKNSKLLRGVIHHLMREGFVLDTLQDKNA